MNYLEINTFFYLDDTLYLYIFWYKYITSFEYILIRFKKNDIKTTNKSLVMIVNKWRKS